MKRIICIVALCVLVSGCGPQLKALMDFNSRQKATLRYAEIQQKKYQRLLSDIEKNTLQVGSLTKDEALRLYGDPILEKQVDNQQALLYRDPMDFFPDKKVYLFFDADQILRKFDVQSLPK